jgi:soluble lytic murein transglycosylase-like protein
VDRNAASAARGRSANDRPATSPASGGLPFSHSRVVCAAGSSCDGAAPPSRKPNWLLGRGSSRSANEAYAEIIRETAAAPSIDLIHAVMRAESAFHPTRFRAGAEGLMQLMPELSNEMGLGDIRSAREHHGRRPLSSGCSPSRRQPRPRAGQHNAGPGNVGGTAACRHSERRAM